MESKVSMNHLCCLQHQPLLVPLPYLVQGYHLRGVMVFRADQATADHLKVAEKVVVGEPHQPIGL